MGSAKEQFADRTNCIKGLQTDGHSGRFEPKSKFNIVSIPGWLPRTLLCRS